jgi:hypothetical protein
MKPRPGYPVIYEINTWVWLWEQSQTCNRQVTLGTVPRRNGISSQISRSTPSG